MKGSFSLCAFCAFLWLSSSLPRGYLQITAAIFEIKEIMRRGRNALALHELALWHLKSDVVLALSIGRPPRQAGAFIVGILGVDRGPTSCRLLINAVRDPVFLTFDTVVLNHL